MFNLRILLYNDAVAWILSIPQNHMHGLEAWSQPVMPVEGPNPLRGRE